MFRSEFEVDVQVGFHYNDDDPQAEYHSILRHDEFHSGREDNLQAECHSTRHRDAFRCEIVHLQDGFHSRLHHGGRDACR